jgi:hypothetical protein
MLIQQLPKWLAWPQVEVKERQAKVLIDLGIPGAPEFASF